MKLIAISGIRIIKKKIYSYNYILVRYYHVIFEQYTSINNLITIIINGAYEIILYYTRLVIMGVELSRLFAVVFFLILIFLLIGDLKNILNKNDIEIF